MSELRKILAKSKIKNQDTRSSPWPAEAWQAARMAFLSSTVSPLPRFPIIISEDGLFPTAEKLQQLADLPLAPDIKTTTTVPMPWEDTNPPLGGDREVHFCDADWDIKSKIEDLTEGESIHVWF
ncbi:hypothetical protein VE02_03877 [Pseudogymnoascus sp. 03VT05]|nr:hypothetical protein VE02_03877 [Pseudogymnoascus sp. 03VT05]